MRRLRRLGVIVATLAVLASVPTASATHDGEHWFSGEWKMVFPDAPTTGPLTLRAASESDVRGEALLFQHSVWLDANCTTGAATQWYTGSATRGADHGPIVACTNSGSGLIYAIFKSTYNVEVAISWPRGNSALASSFNLPDGPVDYWNIFFVTHFGADGARGSATCNPVPGNFAQIESLSGEVRYRSHSGAWAPARVGMPLCTSDELQTGLGSTVTLTCPGGARFTLRELSQIAVATVLTRAGRARTHILLRMGEAAARVKPKGAVQTDFEIQMPTATASVRGTVFSAAYDPGSRTSTVVTQEGTVSVDPAGPKPAVDVRAGHAVTATPAGVTPVRLAQVTAKATARRVVLRKLARASAPCRLTTTRITVAANGTGWRVTASTSKGRARWTVAGSRATPANPLARRVDARCA